MNTRSALNVSGRREYQCTVPDNDAHGEEADHEEEAAKVRGHLFDGATLSVLHRTGWTGKCVTQVDLVVFFLKKETTAALGSQLGHVS